MTGARRRAVFVSQRYPPEQGGNASRIRDTSVSLVEQGWDVTVLAPVKSYPFGEFERSKTVHTVVSDDGVSLHRFWTWQPTHTGPGLASRLAYYLVFAMQAVWWLLRHYRQYDVVITSSPPITTELPGIVASFLGKRWVADVRDLWIDAAVSLGHISARGFSERAARGFQRYALHTADRLTVTTDATTEALEEAYGPELRAKTILIPNGVDTDLFYPMDVETKSEIVYTGNIGSAQDLESCVRAMSFLSHEDAVLRLVGSGDMKPKLERLASQLSLRDRVVFTGLVSREEVPKILNEACIGIAPLKDTEALQYAIPTKVYEYMACGIPTLVTGGERIEWFINQSGGGVHAENDPERIAAELDRLLTDETRREKLTEQGYEYVVKRYTRGGIARRLHEELAALIDDPVTTDASCKDTKQPEQSSED